MASIEDYLINEETVRVYTNANVAATNISEMVSDKNELGYAFSLPVETVDKETRALIVDKDFNVLYDTSTIDSIRGKIFINDVLKSAMSGKDDDRLTKNREVGYSLEISVPIIRNAQIIGSVYMISSLSATKEFVEDTQFTLFLMSVLISIIIGMLSSVIAGLISTPIEKLIAITKDIANGKFDKRADVGGANEMMQLTTSFNVMAQRLKILEEKRSLFVSDASHELKTPLTGIKLVADSLLQMENPNQEILTEFLTDMNNEVDRLTRIIDRLLKLTKLDIDTENLERQTLCVNDIVKNIVRSLLPVAYKKRIALKLRETEPCYLSLSKDRIWEAIYNIIDNAIKYTNRRDTIQIKIDRDEQNVRISVKDNGIGIPKNELTSVFERFYRVDKARARDTGGTGLGLAISSDAVKIHGGHIEVYSAENMGSEFVIVLPINDK